MSKDKIPQEIKKIIMEREETVSQNSKYFLQDKNSIKEEIYKNIPEKYKKMIQSRDYYEFKEKDFEYKEILHGNNNMMLYKAKLNSANLIGLEIVIKEFTKVNKKFANELKTFIKITYHPNIIWFYGFLSDKPKCLVFEYTNQGDLRGYLSKKFAGLTWDKKIKLCKDISLGLLFLYENSIVHKDLWDKNILIAEGVAKICDFGFTKIENSGDNSNSILFNNYQ
ncbi:12156_t:CDS:1 [Gigaspora margarita]|uniref:12156_t:CDS:1 n=1 Tax=Gigaspora margarita TaxID=4874 RepID=A0ABN7X1W3_GIGMA|nr:12156_t:CDS:1 [Gigaspora margarita]